MKDFWVLITAVDDLDFIADVTENDLGEITIHISSKVEEAMKFDTYLDAFYFRRHRNLKVWVVEVFDGGLL